MLKGYKNPKKPRKPNQPFPPRSNFAIKKNNKL